MVSSIGMANMGTSLNYLLALLMLVSLGSCSVGVGSPSAQEEPSIPIQSVARVTDLGASAALNTGESNECVNYLKGKIFIGENFRLKFDHEGNVSAYDQDGQLVFGGTLELGAAVSDVSRWITVRSISGGDILQFLLSNDGKLMEPGSLMIYRPE